MKFWGHPKVSLTSNIKEDMVHKDLESNTTRFYIFDKTPIDRATGNKLRSYKVEKLGFLYLAEYYGET
ncbi:hypothetical protein ACH36K_10475 [Clostridium sp. MB05]|uniref:hypothetical protein n=1 Tax=Clostridium sp. MB05 TaxID=3376682 RepID=UPI003982CE3C